MKKLHVLILVILIGTPALAVKKTKGDILYDKDTVRVSFLIPTKAPIPSRIFSQEINFVALEHGVKYLDPTGKKKILKSRKFHKNQMEYIVKFYNFHCK